jgi:sec-independent protein translocase protein TatC
MDSTKKPVVEHLDELRWRLLTCVVPLLAGAIAAAAFHQQLLRLILSPLDQAVYFSSPMGGLQLIISLALLSGVIITMPVFTYQAVRFMEPALPEFSRARALLIVLASCFLLIAGILFAYLVSLPAALRFLVSFETEDIRSLISAGEYFSFVAYYLLGFGIIFQLPLIMLVINALHRLHARQMIAALKYVLLGSFIVAAILTPTPDPVNQLMMALPIVVLYLLSMLLIAVANRHNKKNGRDGKAAIENA